MKKIALFVLTFVVFLGCIQSAQNKGSFTVEGGNPVGSQLDSVNKNSATQVSDSLGESAYECDPTPKEREFDVEAYYTGPLIDAHLHMPVLFALPPQLEALLPYEDTPVLEKDVTSDEIVCLLEKEGIIKAIGFYPVLETLVVPAINHIKKIEEKHPGKITAFFMPPPLFTPLYKPEKLDEILTEYPTVFSGYGELATYYPIFDGTSPNDPQFLETYKVLEKHNKIVMLHPTPENMDALENAIQLNPNVTFLLHGDNVEDQVIPLLEKHDNAYYSLDTSLVKIYGPSSAEEFNTALRKEFHERLNAVIEKWKPIIEAHPDKFMWGTDRLETWHFDQNFGGLLEEFSRSFIGSLDKEVQEKFAYKNAEGILEEGT
ncbi:MAG: amidohydrolase family protein [Candidatus Diapherotrites archaeon]|nr:amidohydrolase family protein [Candidatus Diapherotrites archaeon]